MKKSQNFFIVPLLIAIIALMAVGGGVYVYESKKSEVPAVVYTEIQQSNQVQLQTTQTPPVTIKQAPSITVLSPSAGKRVSAGSSFLIKWKSVGISNRVLIILHLSGDEQVISSYTANEVTELNDGSFIWRVPETFDELNSTPVDRDYGAYITINDAQNKNIIGQSKNFTIVPANGLKTYSDNSVSFEYPPLLKLGQTEEGVTLNHSIPYKHSNSCDFKGDAPPLDKLTDFNISIKVVNKNPKDYVQSSGWPDWDYVSKNPFRLGSFSGYRVTPGVEGCGQDLYYLTISQNKTLVITRALVSEFDSINTDYQMFLKLPGIITQNQAEVLFTQILASLKVK